MFFNSTTKLGSQKSHSSRLNDKKLLEQFKDIYFEFFLKKENTENSLLIAMRDPTH